MKPPLLPEQPGPNAEPADVSRHMPDGINPWRSRPAYVALGCTTVGLTFLPVPFIGGAGMLLVLFGLIFAGKVQITAMTGPRRARTLDQSWLNLPAWLCVIALVGMAFFAVIIQASAMQAASHGSAGRSGEAVAEIILLSCGVSMVLAVLVNLRRDAEPLQLIPLALYWTCYVPLPVLLVSLMWRGASFRN